MSLWTWAGARVARAWVNEARTGKKGEDVKGFMAAIDGYKRIIVLAVALLQLWLLQQFHVDVSAYARVGFAALGWDPTQLVPVDPVVMATTVAGLAAIADGVRKALRERAAAQAAALKASAAAAPASR